MKLVVLRPEPGNAATCARGERAGFDVLSLPLFAIRPLDWQMPERAFDALLLTSANAVRFGRIGPARDLPVLAVGDATATAARAAGFEVVLTGASDAEALLALATGYSCILHLTGRDHSVEPGGSVAQIIPVYASEPLDVLLPDLGGTIALLHSARAAERFAALVDPKDIRIACLSAKVATAAGPGWSAVAVADSPTDAALLRAAHALSD